MTRSLLLVAAVALAVAAAPDQACAQKAVILIRHADRADGDALKDPAGFERAKALANVLKDAGVTAIVRSDANRVKETVKPLIAALLPHPPSEIEVPFTTLDAHVAKAVTEIKGAGTDAVVLFVGHQNTLGPVLKALGGPDEYPFGTDEFGNMVVLVPGGTKPTVLHLHYSGKP